MNNHKNVRSVLMLSPQTAAGSATVTANLDCKGFGDAEILVTIGAATTAPSSIKIFESDDTVVTNFSELTALSTGNAAVTADQHVRFFVDRSNGARKRYLRVAITTAATTTLSAHGLLDRAAVNPNSTSGYGSNVVKEL